MHIGDNLGYFTCVYVDKILHLMNLVDLVVRFDFKIILA